MQTRSIEARFAHSHIATALVAALVACGSAQAQEAQPGAPTLVAALGPIGPAYVRPQATDSTIDQAISAVTVSAAVRRPEPWDGFRNSVASAATPSCFGLDALSREEFAPEGLLRLPFLAHAAATGACR